MVRSFPEFAWRTNRLPETARKMRVAFDNANYILPVDVPDMTEGQETRLKGAALAEQYIISELRRRDVQVAIVVLDACRTNPFGRGGAVGRASPGQVEKTPASSVASQAPSSAGKRA